MDQSSKPFKELLLPRCLFKNVVPVELLRSLSNHVQTFNFLSIIFLDVKKKQQHKNPKTFSCLASIISHTCRQRCSHLTGRRQQAKAEADLLRLVLVIQGWKSGANQAATKRGKNSKHQATSMGGDHADALCLSGSALSPNSM